MQKGILLKERDIYSIHYKLMTYMRLKAECSYAIAINVVRIEIVPVNDYILKHQKLFW